MSTEHDEQIINYTLDQGTSNELILKSNRKRRTTADDDKTNNEECRRPKKNKKAKATAVGSDGRLAKKKRRQLLQIVERKKHRQSRESLLTSLLEHQLEPNVRQQLLSTQRMQNKKTNQRNNVDDDDGNRKLSSSIAGAARRSTSDAIDRRQDDTYFETDDSSSSDDEVPVAKPSIIELKQEEIVIADTKRDEPQTLQIEQVMVEPQLKVPTINVPVMRRADVEATRCKLPIFAEEQTIVEAIRENTVTVICGETGSGKTTQVPQFLYEAGYAQNDRIIGITEPRRVAAIAMSARVGYELNRPDIVAYQIRYEGDRNANTRILFMTDGVLLREVQHDVMLSRYSVIIIDEAHERSMYSDVLIGLLSRIAPMRAAKMNDPLKLIVMSATLRLTDFTQSRLFPSPPSILNVESRQFPVTIHFSRRTADNYLDETYRKVCRIHTRLPTGGILVFVSGQQEIRTLLRWLRVAYPSRSRQSDNDNDEKTTKSTAPPLYCLPLYSLLSPDKQSRVFAPPPPDSRLCIIATNVAETSITIPGIRYVIDCGKEKTRMYDPITGVTRFAIRWICKASAAQRAGRAGRTAPGHAYRLYSSAVFNDEMAEFGEPEIVCKPVDQLVLQLKSMNIIRVRNFPFPTAPDADALNAAECRLTRMGALDESTTRITALGKTMALFPLAPAFAKLLAIADQHSLLPYAVCLVAALSVREPMYALTGVRGETDDETRTRMTTLMQQRRIWAHSSYQSRQLGDLGVLIKAVCCVEHEGGGDDVCDKYGMHTKANIEIRKLRRQLTNIINRACSELSSTLVLDAHMQPMSEMQEKMLRQTVLAGLAEQVARRVDRLSTDEPIPKGAYQTQQMKVFSSTHQSLYISQDYVFIHPSSVLYTDTPDYVLYQEIVQFSDKKCMLTVCAIDPDWLPTLATAYCRFEPPSADALAHYDRALDRIVIPMSTSFSGWQLGNVDRPHPTNLNLYRWFAVAFLAGDICQSLAAYTSRLLAAPTTMMKSWARLQPRTEHLLNALVEFSIASGNAFEKRCAIDRNYLLDEYCEWLPESTHDEVRNMWPPKFNAE